MKWHVVHRAGPHDTYCPPLSGADATLEIATESPGHPGVIGSDLKRVLTQRKIVLSVAAEDCLTAAMVAYAADARVLRSSGFDGWTRDLHLHLAVRHPDRWATVADPFVRMLSFLTGDHWELTLRRAPGDYGELSRADEVVHPEMGGGRAFLFSGGLDSFVGALDELKSAGKVVLVGHHRADGGPTSRSQHEVFSHIEKLYPQGSASFIRTWIDPPAGLGRSSETTTRGRSVLFVALGVAVAEAIGSPSLIIPENGFISLNVPLHEARTGSHSTRTTHPYFISLWQSVLRGLGIAVTIDLPYSSFTKGELLQGCTDQGGLLAGITKTMSCAHPAAQRFAAIHKPNVHCGYCTPCIVRRAAIAAVTDDPTQYAIPDLTSGLSPRRRRDLWAFRLAADRFRHHPPGVQDILRSGPLPVSDTDIASFLAMYRRGIAELTTFLDQHT